MPLERTFLRPRLARHLQDGNVGHPTRVCEQRVPRYLPYVVQGVLAFWLAPLFMLACLASFAFRLALLCLLALPALPPLLSSLPLIALPPPR